MLLICSVFSVEPWCVYYLWISDCSSGVYVFDLRHVRVFFFFKQKTAYEMRISDWSSDVCSSDLSTSRTPNGAACARGSRTIAASTPCGSGSGDRKSVVKGKSVSVRVDLGGRRIIKQKKKS